MAYFKDSPLLKARDKMKALLIISIFFLVGCGNFSKSIAEIKGHSEICIDGVTYLQFTSGATVKYNKTGTISTCK